LTRPDRLNDAPAALKKANDLLAIKPGERRAREIQEKFTGYGQRGRGADRPVAAIHAALERKGLDSVECAGFRPRAVFGAMTAIIVTYLGRTQANASWPIAALRAARLGACNG